MSGRQTSYRESECCIQFLSFRHQCGGACSAHLTPHHENSARRSTERRGARAVAFPRSSALERSSRSVSSPFSHFVSATHLIRLALIVVWQAVMVAAVLYFDSSPRRWLPSLFAVAALLVPFVCYIIVVYDLPVLAKWSRIVRASVLTLSSIVVTIAGYTVMFLADLVIRGEL